MTGAGKSVGAVFGSVLAAAACAAPPMPAGPAGYTPLPPAADMTTPMPMAMPAGSAGMVRVPIGDLVDPTYKDAVLKVVRQPTISTRGTSEAVVTTPTMYEWLLDHPDRVSLAWRRLKVECVPISDLGNGKFGWTDGEGSELVWQAVGRFPDGLVWYATGKVKPNAVTPTVPVKAVVILTHAKTPAADGTASITPVAQVYLHTDSRVANTVMRVLGPTAPKLAEQGAEQLLYFFNGIAKYAQTHPEKAETLLAPPKQGGN